MQGGGGGASLVPAGGMLQRGTAAETDSDLDDWNVFMPTFTWKVHFRSQPAFLELGGGGVGVGARCPPPPYPTVI